MDAVLERSYSKRKVARKRVKTNGAPRSYKWTVDEYYELGELGLFYGKRVQLIRGEIIEMSPMKSGHFTAIRMLTDILAKIFGQGYEIRPQAPLRLGGANEPEPDIAVVVGSVSDYAAEHPTSAVLVVEVADSSLRFDRTTKLRLYAENGIEDYWILNLKQRQLEVYRTPQGDSPEGFSYGEKLVFKEDEFVAPLAKPNAQIKVADLLP